MAKKKKKVAKKSENEQAFESSLAELQEIVGELESGALGLSEALARYEQGVKHLKNCHAHLEHAERKIEILSGFDSNGNPITEVFEEGTGEESLDEKAASRSKRRTRTTTKPRLLKDDEAGVDDGGRLF